MAGISFEALKTGLSGSFKPKFLASMACAVISSSLKCFPQYLRPETRTSDSWMTEPVKAVLYEPAKSLFLASRSARAFALERLAESEKEFWISLKRNRIDLLQHETLSQ